MKKGLYIQGCKGMCLKYIFPEKIFQPTWLLIGIYLNNNCPKKGTFGKRVTKKIFFVQSCNVYGINGPTSNICDIFLWQCFPCTVVA